MFVLIVVLHIVKRTFSNPVNQRFWNLISTMKTAKSALKYFWILHTLQVSTNIKVYNTWSIVSHNIVHEDTPFRLCWFGIVGLLVFSLYILLHIDHILTLTLYRLISAQAPRIKFSWPKAITKGDSPLHNDATCIERYV